MSDILSLGNGFYDLETTPTSAFRWTKDVFTFYFEQNVSEIELFVVCNKVYQEYDLLYSTDNWQTSHKTSLNDGENILSIDVKNAKKIDFKSTCFIPSDFWKDSSDHRKLGVRFHTIYCKTDSNEFFDISSKDIRFKNEVDADKPYYIKESSFYVTLKEGWHELEDNLFRWSTGNGVLVLNTDKFDNLKLIISSPRQELKVYFDDNTEFLSFSLTGDRQEIVLENIKQVKKIIFANEFFKSEQKTGLLVDDRELGMQLYSIELYNNNDADYVFALIKNLFFDSDKQQLSSFTSFNFSDVEISEINSEGHVVLKSFSPNSDSGKFNMNDQLVFYTHTAGWSYVIESIKELHGNTDVKFEGFLERNFFWEKYKNIKDGKLPFKNKWVGVIHNPMTHPFEKEDVDTTNKLLRSIVFMKSLETCKGLYVLSNDLKKKIEGKVGNVPVEFLYHPTIFPKVTFDWDKFLDNKEKLIVNIGSWSRKHSSIFLLKKPKHFKKVSITPLVLNEEKLNKLIKKEEEYNKIKLSNDHYNSVEKIGYQTLDEYNELLSKNVVFTDFYDISASNLVVECIVRNTPILIRKHNAVVDYLGEEYPFYYETLEEAYEQVKDINLIKVTFEYLKNLKTKKFLTGKYFKNSITNGNIYKSL